MRGCYLELYCCDRCGNSQNPSIPVRRRPSTDAATPSTANTETKRKQVHEDFSGTDNACRMWYNRKLRKISGFDERKTPLQRIRPAVGSASRQTTAPLTGRTPTPSLCSRSLSGFPSAWQRRHLRSAGTASRRATPPLTARTTVPLSFLFRSSWN